MPHCFKTETYHSTMQFESILVAESDDVSVAANLHHIAFICMFQGYDVEEAVSERRKRHSMTSNFRKEKKKRFGDVVLLQISFLQIFLWWFAVAATLLMTSGRVSHAGSQWIWTGSGSGSGSRI